MSERGGNGFDVQAAIAAAANIMPPLSSFELPTLENLARRCDELEYQVRELIVRVNYLMNAGDDEI